MSELNETTVIAEEPTARNPLVLGLAVVAALLAGALVWFFVAAPLLAGDDTEDTTAVPSASAPAADDGEEKAADDAPADGVAEAAEETALPIVTYEVFLDRDPFDPVVPEPASTTQTDGSTDDGTTTDGATDDGTTDDGTTDGGTTDGGTTDGGTTDGGTAPDGCTTGDEELVCDGRVVSLIEIRTGDDGEPLAVVQVDTTLYEVRVGQVFAGSFQVQAITGDMIYLLYGDDAFELDEGDRVLK